MNFFDRLCLGKTEIKNALGLFIIIAVMAGACMANLNAGMWGTASAWNLLASLLYLLFWIAFPKLFGSSRMLMKTAYIISICTFGFAVCSSISVWMDGASPFYMILLIPSLVGLVTTVPFYGLTFLLHGISGSFRLHYPAVAILALCWVWYMRKNLQKNQSDF